MAKKSETTEALFTKEQFLNSKTYRQHKDILSVILHNDKTYSKEQVNKIINDFIGKEGK